MSVQAEDRVVIDPAVWEAVARAIEHRDILRAVHQFLILLLKLQFNFLPPKNESSQVLAHAHKYLLHNTYIQEHSSKSNQ